MAAREPANIGYLGGHNSGAVPRDQSARPFGRLLVLSADGNIEQECAIDKTTMFLGRDPECDLQFNRREISRRHCVLTVKDDSVFVTREGRLPILLNGRPIEAGTAEELSFGDSIEVMMDDHRKTIRFEDNDDTILLNEAIIGLAQPLKDTHNPDEFLTETTNTAANESPGRSPNRATKRLSSPPTSKGTSQRKSPPGSVLGKRKATVPSPAPVNEANNLGEQRVKPTTAEAPTSTTAAEASGHSTTATTGAATLLGKRKAEVLIPAPLPEAANLGKGKRPRVEPTPAKVPMRTTAAKASAIATAGATTSHGKRKAVPIPPPLPKPANLGKGKRQRVEPRTAEVPISTAGAASSSQALGHPVPSAAALQAMRAGLKKVKFKEPSSKTPQSGAAVKQPAAAVIEQPAPAATKQPAPAAPSGGWSPTLLAANRAELNAATAAAASLIREGVTAKQPAPAATEQPAPAATEQPAVAVASGGWSPALLAANRAELNAATAAAASLIREGAAPKQPAAAATEQPAVAVASGGWSPTLLASNRAALGAATAAAASLIREGAAARQQRAPDGNDELAGTTAAEKPAAKQPPAKEPAGTAASSTWSPALLAANRAAFDTATAHAASLIRTASVQGEKPAAVQPTSTAASNGWSPNLLASNQIAFRAATAAASALVQEGAAEQRRKFQLLFGTPDSQPAGTPLAETPVADQPGACGLDVGASQSLLRSTEAELRAQLAVYMHQVVDLKAEVERLSSLNSTLVLESDGLQAQVLTLTSLVEELSAKTQATDANPSQGTLDQPEAYPALGTSDMALGSNGAELADAELLAEEPKAAAPVEAAVPVHGPPDEEEPAKAPVAAAPASGRVLPLQLANRLPVIGAPLTPIPEVPEGKQGDGPTEAMVAGNGPAQAMEAANGPAEAMEAANGPAEAMEAANGPAEAMEAANSPAEAMEAANGPAEAMEAANGPAEAMEAANGPMEAMGPAVPAVEEDCCMVCRLPGRGKVLLICDGCEATSHLSCAGHRKTPKGAWFCRQCMPTGAEAASQVATSRKEATGPKEATGYKQAAAKPKATRAAKPAPKPRAKRATKPAGTEAAPAANLRATQNGSAGPKALATRTSCEKTAASSAQTETNQRPRSASGTASKPSVAASAGKQTRAGVRKGPVSSSQASDLPSATKKQKAAITQAARPARRTRART